MIKYEILSKVQKPYYYPTQNNTIDSNKENKRDNFKKINLGDKENKFKNKNKLFSINNNEKNKNVKTSLKDNSNNINKFKNILNNKNIKKNLNMKNIIEPKNKINNNYYNNQNVKKNCEKINYEKLTKKNIPLRQNFRYDIKEKLSKIKLTNKDPPILSKQIYTPHYIKNSLYSTEINKNYISFTSNNTPTYKKLTNLKENQNYLTQKNNNQINENKNNFKFNSVIIKRETKEQNIKNSFSQDEMKKKEMIKKNISKNEIKNNLSHEEEISKDSKLEKINKNKITDIMELIKVKKNETEILTQKEREAEEEIKKNNENNNSNKDELIENKEEYKNEKKETLKKIKMNQILYKQKIFHKIRDEEKEENNSFHKIFHRQIINHRDSYNSFNNNKRKYDTNTYKEITTKKIKYPFNTLSNVENGNNFTINTEEKDNNINNLNISCINMNTNKDINKKSSIKIKKIPLNKLKRKIRINNINNINSNINHYSKTNTNNNRNSIDNIDRIITSSNPINQVKNSYSTSYFQNTQITNAKILHKIPTMNYHKTNNLINNMNNEYFKKINNWEDKPNILYNKVRINIPGMKNRKYVQKNNNNTFNNTYNNDINIDNNNSQSNLIIKNYSVNMDYFKRNFKNILSENCLSNANQEKKINNTISNNENKNNQNKEKKLGLFKKINSFENKNKSFCFNNVYSKKKNITIFKCYMSNTNKTLNESNKRINYANSNRNIDSISLLSLDSNFSDNLKIRKYLSDFNKIKKGIQEKNICMINENQINDIKLEQIITLLSFEDLLILEDKLNIIFNLLKNNKKIYNGLFDLWNYFFSSTIKIKLEQIYKYYLKETESIKIFINYSLILIIIYYDFSLNSNINNNNICFTLYESLRLVYINLLIVISSIKNKIKLDNKDHYNLRLIEMSNINRIIGENLINFNNNSYNEQEISFNRELLHNNVNLLIKNTSKIIKNYNQSNISYLFNTINNYTFEDINSFFRKKILREDFLGCSVLASTYLKEKQNFIPEKVPYIQEKSKKKYSLILDLDETLINFKINHEQNDEGVLKLRPGILAFLETVREYYEIILFTEGSEGYTNLIMEALNKNEYFDYKLYRQHTIIIDEDFVKDLQRIGRPLDRIIIIDNLAQNFRMQKTNGINIKPFYGEDQNDQALYDLIPILINIAKDNIDTRNGLVKYRDEIITKITSNLYKRNNEK